VGVGDHQCTPARSRALSERRNAVQSTPSSLWPTSKPSTSRPPSAVTPVAITTARLTTARPPARGGGGVDEQVREGGVGQRAGPEGGHLAVQLGADPADLRLGDARVDAKGLDQVVDLASGGAVHVGLHHHRQQRPVDAAAGLGAALGRTSPPEAWGCAARRRRPWSTAAGRGCPCDGRCATRFARRAERRCAGWPRPRSAPAAPRPTVRG
jgi:hypothetical protein